MTMRILNFLCAGLALSMASAANAGLIISEVVDGDLSGGNPKFVELTNTGTTDFTFTGGGIILQSNAATDLDIDVSLTGVTIPAGDSFVIQSSANGGEAVFESTYGFAADLYTGAFFSNGDDRYILTTADDSSVIVDIHGEIDVDGSGTAWEYLDSYAYRNADVLEGNGGVFDITEWFHAGVGALDTLDAAGHVALTTPGTHDFNAIPEPGTAILALLSLASAGAVTMRSRLG
ncbi:lamin tail domain-containing protein [Botrimarina mediterranea]|nr:lamin tail domain-containing protein [Botrimarina mediterranea]